MESRSHFGFCLVGEILWTLSLFCLSIHLDFFWNLCPSCFWLVCFDSFHPKCCNCPTSYHVWVCGVAYQCRPSSWLSLLSTFGEVIGTQFGDVLMKIYLLWWHIFMRKPATFLGCWWREWRCHSMWPTLCMMDLMIWRIVSSLLVESRLHLGFCQVW